MAAPNNPLRDALSARDPEMDRAAFAEDVVVHSPIFSVEIDGIEEATDVMAAVFQTVGEMDYFYDERGPELHVFAWRTDVDGGPLEGVDIVKYDAAGKINELTIQMRPLRGIAAFLDKGGPILAKKQSRGRALLMRAMGPPPSMMMRSVARLGPKMLGLKKAKKQTWAHPERRSPPSVGPRSTGRSCSSRRCSMTSASMTRPLTEAST